MIFHTIVIDCRPHITRISRRSDMLSICRRRVRFTRMIPTYLILFAVAFLRQTEFCHLANRTTTYYRFDGRVHVSNTANDAKLHRHAQLTTHHTKRSQWYMCDTLTYESDLIVLAEYARMYSSIGPGRSSNIIDQRATTPRCNMPPLGPAVGLGRF